MRDPHNKTIALNVRLKPSDSSAHPRATNYTNVALAQGVAYLDFGFMEPALLAISAKMANEDQAGPKCVEGHLVTRVAMDVSTVARLQQQIQQLLAGLSPASQPKSKK